MSIYCPVCGFEVSKYTDDFTIGDICYCCGLVCDVDDNLDYFEIKCKFDKVYLDHFNLTNDYIEAHLEDLADFCFARKLIRVKWISEGFKWYGYLHLEYKPNPWNLEVLSKQLQQIGIEISEYLL